MASRRGSHARSSRAGSRPRSTPSSSTSGGELRLVATAKQGIDPKLLVAPLHAAVAALRATGPSDDELGRAVAALDADQVSGLENLAVRAHAIADRIDERGTSRGGLLVPFHIAAADVKRAAGSWLADGASATVIGR